MLAVFFIGDIMTNMLSIPFYSNNMPLVGASAVIFAVAATVMLIKLLKFSSFFPWGLWPYFAFCLMFCGLSWFVR